MQVLYIEPQGLKRGEYADAFMEVLRNRHSVN